MASQQEQFEMGMILRDAHGELYDIINEREGPPKMYEVRDDIGIPMLGTDELHFGLNWLKAEEMQGEGRTLEIVGRHLPTCNLNGPDRHSAPCNCTSGQLVQQACDLPPVKAEEEHL